MHHHRRALVCLLVALTVLVSFAAPAVAGAPTDRMREFFANVNQVIADPAFDERFDERIGALRRLVVELVDFRSAATTALGPAWSARSASERDEFVRLFTDLLQASVVTSVGARARIHRGLSVTYVGETGDKDAITVLTSVLTRAGGDMTVGYRMAPRGGRWIVQDLVVDGVSLVENYRAQFQKVMQRSSYAALVSEMRTRIDDMSRTTAFVATPSVPAPILAAAPLAPLPAREPAPAPIEPVTDRQSVV